MNTIICKGCGESFSYAPRRGRPPVKCDTCKAKTSDAVHTDEDVGVKEDLDLGIDSDDVDLEPIVEDDDGTNGQDRKSYTDTQDRDTYEPDPNLVPTKEDEAVKVEVEHTFRLHVTNFGWDAKAAGEDEKKAKDRYKYFSEMSSRGYGQVGFEIVTLYCKGDVIAKYDPKTDGVACTKKR